MKLFALCPLCDTTPKIQESCFLLFRIAHKNGVKNNSPKQIFYNSDLFRYVVLKPERNFIHTAKPPKDYSSIKKGWNLSG